MSRAILKLDALGIGHQGAGLLMPPVSLEVVQPSLIALAGVNGAGKTTLLKTITGLLPPKGGSVWYGEKQLHKLSPHDKALTVSIVLTEFPDDFYLRTDEVVAMGRYPYNNFWGRLSENDRSVVTRSMEWCGISHLSGRRFISLSDGEKQKTFIAKAIAQDTPLIVLDEPAAFLDYPGKLELMGLLRTLVHEAGKTVVFSSHDLELALRFADRMWLVAAGQTLADGTPEKLVTRGTINAFFDRQRLHYDVNTGIFVSSDKPLKPVFLHLQLPHRKWLLNALQRAGFCEAQQAEMQIVPMDDAYQLIIGDKSYFCSDIDEVLKQIIKDV